MLICQEPPPASRPPNFKSLLAPLVMIMGLMCSTSSFAQSKTFEAPKDGFSLQMPQNWKKLSDAEYLAFTNYVLRTTGVDRSRLPAYILESPHNNEHESKQILIFVKRIPNSASDVFEELVKQQEDVVSSAVKLVEKDLSSHEISIGTPKFVLDNKTGYLWLHGTPSSGQMEGEFSSLAVMIPTSYGLIHLTGTVPKDQYPAFIPVFHSIVSSIKLADPPR